MKQGNVARGVGVGQGVDVADSGVGVLPRGWLRHVDNTGLAVLDEACTPAARLCRRCPGFRPIEEGLLRLYQLPAGHNN